MSHKYYFLSVLIYLLFNNCAFAQYEEAGLGDIIDIHGQKAIVFKTDGYGHGCALSVDALRGRMDPIVSDINLLKGVSWDFTSNDGKANTTFLYDLCSRNNIPVSSFPVLKWCQSLGEGWFIPSVQELEDFVNYWIGNVQELDWESEEENVMDVSAPTPEEVNKKMVEAGGIPFLSYGMSNSLFCNIVTSTITPDLKVYSLVMNLKKNKRYWKFKQIPISSLTKYSVCRACYAF